MSGYNKALKNWVLARGIGYPRSCQECPERKEGCYKNCRFIKAYKNENDVPRYIKLPQSEYLTPTVEELEAFATKLYQSPIEIIMQEMQTQFDGEVFKATQAYGINVDKDELIKALQYDRDQYNKGFADGSRIDTTAIRAEVEYWKEQCFNACMNNGCLDKAIVDAAIARKIFEEIEKYMMDSVDVTHTAYKTIGTSTFAILKKKYTEGGK